MASVYSAASSPSCAAVACTAAIRLGAGTLLPHQRRLTVIASCLAVAKTSNHLGKAQPP